ncbi:MAG: hypothetical protein ABMA64_05545 [Myxococcota bacterium]
MWKVQRGELVSHVLGTCHIPIPLDHALPAPHDAVLRSARVLVGELDLQQMLEPMGAPWRGCRCRRW